MEKYKLLKDLPIVPKGSIFEYCGVLGAFCFIDKNLQLNYWTKQEIEEMKSGWFKKLSK